MCLLYRPSLHIIIYPGYCRTAAPWTISASSAAPSAACHSPTSSATIVGLCHRSTGVRVVGTIVHSNKCRVVCSLRPHRGQFGCSSASMLCRYALSRGHFPALSWARVLRVALGSCSSVLLTSGACCCMRGCICSSFSTFLTVSV